MGDAEEAYKAWRECSPGRPCDYSGLTYEKLRGGGESSGRVPPRRRTAPSTSIYHHFRTDQGQCETYGHDLATGASVTKEQHAAQHLDGRARLQGHGVGATARDSDEYPLRLMTGRTVYQFHTRTKTGRAPELKEAAPEPWVELHLSDAADIGLAEGEPVRVESGRGADP